MNFIVGYNGLNLAGVTAHTVTGLEPLTTYQARIRAKGSCDPGPNSNVVNISTLTFEPVAPPTVLTFSNITSSNLTVILPSRFASWRH